MHATTTTRTPRIIVHAGNIVDMDVAFQHWTKEQYYTGTFPHIDIILTNQAEDVALLMSYAQWMTHPFGTDVDLLRVAQRVSGEQLQQEHGYKRLYMEDPHHGQVLGPEDFLNG